MGRWMKTMVADGLAIGDNDSSVTVKLPRSNRIGEVSYILRGTGGAGTPDLESLIPKIDIVADGGSHIVDVSNTQMRDLSQMRSKGIRSEIVNASGADSRCVTNILMGRFKHDPDVILPAYRFTTLDLKLTFNTLIASTAFATGTVKLDVFCDEYIVDEDDIEDDELFIQKITEVTSFTSEASGNKQVELQRGHLLAAVYIRAAGTDGETISKFKVSLNNGADTPIAETWLKSQSDDMIEYGLVGSSGAAKLANVTMIDFDNPATEQIMDEVVDTSPESGIRAADLVLTQGAASQACSVVQLSYIPVAAL